MKLYIPLPDRKPWFDTAEQEIPESDYELIFRNIEMEPFDEALEVGESFEEGEPLEGPTDSRRRI